jgi:endonuclease-3
MPRESTANRLQRALRIFSTLQKTYPDAHCALNHRNAFELLIATILSAQCTDVRVNMVTPELFRQYPTPRKMAQASQAEIEAIIRTTGFFRSKAKALLATSRRLCETYDGKVPDTMDELLTLTGVARKTANVVLGNAFDTNVGVVVDTHVGRLSRRMALTENTDAGKVEKDLMSLFPQPDWTLLAHLLISHGRAICTARNPRCEVCPVNQDCPKIGVTKPTQDTAR